MDSRTVFPKRGDVFCKTHPPAWEIPVCWHDERDTVFESIDDSDFMVYSDISCVLVVGCARSAAVPEWAGQVFGKSWILCT